MRFDVTYIAMIYEGGPSVFRCLRARGFLRCPIAVGSNLSQIAPSLYD